MTEEYNKDISQKPGAGSRETEVQKLEDGSRESDSRN